MKIQKPLFFSGGTAFTSASKAIATITPNATYIVGTFDSGGSTGVLRSIAPIPAVGDVRNRMLTLARIDSPALITLFSFRLSNTPSIEEIEQFNSIMTVNHPLWDNIPQTYHEIVSRYAHAFVENIGLSFPMNNASIGNCLIIGAIFYYGNMYTAVEKLRTLLDVSGIVLPVTEEDLHLVGIDRKGQEYIGQKAITTSTITAPLQNFFLAHINNTKEGTTYTHAKTNLSTTIKKALQEADSICYPMGSFYTSIIAPLLVTGISDAIAYNPCPKIYIPNTGIDTEQGTMSVAECVHVLLHSLGATKENAPQYISHIVVDANSNVYPYGVQEEALPKGIQLIKIPNVATPEGISAESIVTFLEQL